jgi:hypothetical protein
VIDAAIKKYLIVRALCTCRSTTSIGVVELACEFLGRVVEKSRRKKNRLQKISSPKKKEAPC